MAAVAPAAAAQRRLPVSPTAPASARPIAAQRPVEITAAVPPVVPARTESPANPAPASRSARQSVLARAVATTAAADLAVIAPPTRPARTALASVCPTAWPKCVAATAAAESVAPVERACSVKRAPVSVSLPVPERPVGPTGAGTNVAAVLPGQAATPMGPACVRPTAPERSAGTTAAAANVATVRAKRSVRTEPASSSRPPPALPKARTAPRSGQPPRTWCSKIVMESSTRYTTCVRARPRSSSALRGGEVAVRTSPVR